MARLRFALRTLFRSPFVTSVAILSLGLGIGANAAIFSLFNQILLRPLPVPAPLELVNLSAPGPMSGSTSCGGAGSCQEIWSYPMFRDLEAQQTSFTGIAAHRSFGANLAFDGQTLEGDGLLVSGSYFAVLGLTPARGRLLGPQDDGAPGEAQVVVLSHRYWLARFEGRDDVIGRTLIVNGQPQTIVGVGPEGFESTTLGSRIDVFAPITLSEALQPGRRVLDNRRAYWIYLFARLKPGVSRAQAQAAINQPHTTLLKDVEAPLQQGMSDATLARFVAKTVVVEDGSRGQSSTPGEAFAPLVLLLAVTGVVLLSACANIANLLLAKATGRSGEIAVRLSLGASRRQLIGQLLSESVLLASFGGVAGFFVAQWTLAFIATMLPADAIGMLAFTVDARMLGFLAAITIGTGLLFGLFPALHSTRPNLAATLKGQAGQPSGARAARRFRVGLATSQVVLSMALLTLAGLLLKSLVNVSRVDIGIDTDRLIAFGVSPEMNGYPMPRSMQIFEQLEDDLARLPGVDGVSAGIVPLIAGSSWGTNVTVEGFEAGPDADTNSNFNQIAPDFFRTTGIPLLAGREFTRADTLGSPRVAIVSEAFARKFNLGANPIGRRMSSGGSRTLDIEIVGLAKDAKYAEVKDAPPPVFYTPYRQQERVRALIYYVRTSGDADNVLGQIPAMMTRIDPTLPVSNLRTMAQQVRENTFEDRLVTTMAAIFAGLATLLAGVGLYGVLAYTVAQRTREIGLRMALGADAARIRALVLGQVARMTAVGGLAGLAIAAVAGTYAESMLFEMEGRDPLVFAGSAGFLALIAFVAGFIPAWRASRVDPMLALRYE